MNIVELIYNLFKDFMFGDSTLEVWQEQFLTLAVTVGTMALLACFIKYLLDFIFSFFRRF